MKSTILLTKKHSFLAFFLLFVQVSFADTETIDGVTWSYRILNGVASIEGSYAVEGDTPAIPSTTEGAITVPSMLGGCPLTEIGDLAFSSCSRLTSVTIPNSVTSIGNSAFWGCSALTSVTIPDSVTTIGDGAFYHCTALFDQTSIPGVKLVDGWAVDASSPSGDLNLAGVRGVAECAFRHCSGLSSVTIPGSAISIGDSAFLDCSGLTSVTILAGVTSIGDSAFEGCSGLTSVTILAGVTNIGDFAFERCSGLRSIIIPDSVTSIGNDAFYGCSRLESVVIGNGISTLDPFPFNQNLTNVVIGSGVTVIDHARFYGCSNLTSIIIPNSVTNIGDYAFYDCSGLTSIVIPDSVTEIGKEAFYGCSGLTSIVIPDSVTEIGKDAFYDCSDEIYDTTSAIGLKLIDGWVFGYTESLSEVVDLTGIRGIASFAFEGCSTLQSVTIPDSVTSIGDSVFSGCSWLTSIAIPDSVRSIGDSAFSGCSSLASITIPNSVTNIGYQSFSGCFGLESIRLPRSFQGKTSRLGIPADCAILFNGECNLTIVSEFGNPVPSEGVHVCVDSPVVDCSVEQVVPGPSDGIRHQCIGWTGTGRAPASGTGTNVVFAVAVDSSLTWRWRMDVRIQCSVTGDATGGENGWFPMGSSAVVVPFTPGSNSFWVRLFGDSDGVTVDADARTIAIPTDRPRTVEARIVAVTDGNAANGGGAPFEWIPDANAAWFAVADETAADGYCLRSGDVQQGAASSLAATVTGPGRLSFLWRTAANRNDYARFFVDGVETQKIDRSATAWTSVSMDVAAGEHGLVWKFDRGSSAGGAAFLDDVCWTPRHTLAVTSAIGMPFPTVGTHMMDWGDVVEASVAVPEPSAGSRAVCTGWAGTGSVPEVGTGTNVTFTIEQDSSIAWNLRTEHWIDLSVSGDGTTAFSSRWAEDGERLEILLAPTTHLYTIALSGDVEDGVELDGTMLRVTADKPRTIVATIRETKLSLSVSSALGTVDPAAGMYAVSWGSGITAFATPPPAVDGERIACTGWTGTGSVPRSGTGTSVSFAMEEDSTLAWNWRTERWISLETAGPATADFRSAWVEAGETLEVSYDVLFDGACKMALSGDTNGIVWDAFARTLTIPADRTRALRLTAVPDAPPSLAEALDAPGLVWMSAGNNAWTPQRTMTADGVDAAESGNASDGDSILETTLSGAGTLSWSWRLETEAGSGIDLMVGNSTATYIEEDRSGSWIDESIPISGSGEHVVRFVFWNETGAASDRGFVDRVSWTGAVAGGDETTTTPEPVPYAWIVSNGLAAAGSPASAFESAAFAPARNGRPAWECYVAGLDPAKDEDFLAWIEMEDGEPRISWTPSNVVGRAYAVWGRTTLADEWSSPVNPKHRFFQVRINIGPENGVDEKLWSGPVTLTFDATEGVMDPTTRIYTEPGVLGELPIPMREGHVFLGWWTRADGGSRVNESSVVPWSDWTLFARWRPNRYTVRFDANGGFGEMADQEFDCGAVRNLTTNTFVRSGLMFAGWALEEDGAAVYADGARVLDLAAADGAVVTLWSTWTSPLSLSGALNPLLSFETGGDSVWFAETEDSHDGVAAARSGDISDNQDTWIETTVTGAGTGSFWWKSSAEFGDFIYLFVDGKSTGTAYGGEDNTWWRAAFSVSGAGNHTLRWYFAKDSSGTMGLDCCWIDEIVWTPADYTLRFDANGGTIGAMADMEDMLGGVDATIPACRFSRPGWLFAGWSSSADGEVEWTDGERVLGGFSSFASRGVATLYARWQPISYTVRFEASGCTGSMDEQTFQYGTAQALSPCSFVNGGRLFTGWATEEGGSATFADGEIVESLSTENGAVVTLYACWLSGYAVRFDANGGSGEMPPQIFAIDEAKPLSALSFERDGFFFAGWARSPDGQGVFPDRHSVSNLTSTGEATLYAAWAAVEEWSYKTQESGIVISRYSGSSTDVLIPGCVGDSFVTSIGGSAFSGCSRLTSITIPDSVTSIESSAFFGCSGLTSVTIPDGLTSIESSAFYGCSGLTSVAIPDSVTSISYQAFRGCSGLTSITIPNSVTSIGGSAFDGCSGLTSITIPDSVTNIGDYSFYNCSGLTSVTIPDSVTNIGDYSFLGCSGLTSISVDVGNSSYSSINGLLLSNDGRTLICGVNGTVEIPDGVTSIREFAFYGCRGLTSITIPDSVTSIGSSAFYGCRGLTSITIPDSVTSIGSSAFERCSGLTSVAIPDGVTSIGSYAFEHCSGLTSVAIPDSVTSIGSSAFYGCSGLTSITIPDSVTNIGNGTFDGCNSLTLISLPNRFRGKTSNMGIPSGCTVIFR